ncbi:hypothetical protein BaOVIS_032540 [Babesia ovis]|uniref:Uncharacterized protein n=1 Tax=Babesia ovis TaxID=5869 RepID=A0A9W5TDW3_BABOV|nr:hypothetical protein BaOVIS_032540 [Babesia ovis]
MEEVSQKTQNDVTDDAVDAGEQDAQNMVILAYNVPPEYTLYNFEQLMATHLRDTEDVTIIPPFPWQDRADCPWKIIFRDRNEYDYFVNLQEVVVPASGNGRMTVTISFVQGDLDDIPDIPFKEDENLLMSEHCNVKELKH